MSKGSAQRPTDKEAFNAAFDRIFKPVGNNPEPTDKEEEKGEKDVS